MSQTAPYVLIAKFCELTGYTQRAVELKIERGVWIEGCEWIKAPDGHRLMSLRGYAQWVERGHKKAA